MQVSDAPVVPPVPSVKSFAFFHPAFLSAFTPIILALAGVGIVGMCLFTKSDSPEAFGVASAAIAGAAGLAQSNGKKED